MRTNIIIDDDLMAELMTLTGAKTKRQVVATAMRDSLLLRRQTRIRKLRGAIEWVGDLDDMRISKHLPADA